ncbi:unnamed protein product, partial [Cylicocyclus nassatus]
MSRTLLIVLIFQLENVQELFCQRNRFWIQGGKVEVTLVAEENTGHSLEDTYDGFLDLFYAYGRENKINFNRRNLKRKNNFGSTYGSKSIMAKYQAYNIDCNKFQSFLQRIRAWEYRLKFIHVRCDRMSFAICMVFSCPESEFRGLETMIIANNC